MALSDRLDALRSELERVLEADFEFEELESGELGVLQYANGIALCLKEIGSRLFVQFDMAVGVTPEKAEEDDEADLEFECREAIEDMLEDEWDSELYSLEDTVEWAPDSPQMKSLRHLRWAAVEVNREINTAQEVLEIIHDLQNKPSWKEL